uniref:Alanine--tRNA ligase n=1 Tax=Talaromyces marneffei PM1 TaxID=1077442 RepID=A0A093UXW0_TALMA
MEDQNEYSGFNLFSMNPDDWVSEFIRPSDLILPSDCWNPEGLPSIPWDTAGPENPCTVEDVSEVFIPSAEAFNLDTNTSFPEEAEQLSRKVAEIENRLQELQDKLAEQEQELTNIEQCIVSLKNWAIEFHNSVQAAVHKIIQKQDSDSP